MLVMAVLAGLAGHATAAEAWVTVVVSSQLTNPELNAIKNYGKKDYSKVKYAPEVTQLFQGPNTDYWCIVITTQTSSENAYMQTAIGSKHAWLVYAYDLTTDGYTYLRVDNGYPKDWYHVWQSSGTTTEVTP